jgi:hypothetical protein
VDSTAVPANVDIFVLVVDSATLATVGGATVNPSGSLSFAVGSLPAGTYSVYAGSDDDGDLVIGGPGDRFFGAFPTLDQPVALTIAAGQALPAINFAVQQGFAGDSASSLWHKLRIAHE